MGVLVAGLVLLDVFQAVVVPRPITGAIRPAALLVRSTWRVWRRVSLGVASSDKRERRLGIYAPSILIVLIVVWMLGLMVGYGLMLHALRADLEPPPRDFWATLYFAGTSLLTIGYGDVVATSGLARAVAILAGATGLILVALAITFLFSLYASFQRREVLVVTLDELAGAPPSGVTLLERTARYGMLDQLPRIFHEWELWSAEVLDTHLAFPLLAFFRSSHDNESWVGALGAVMDAATLSLTTVEGIAEGPPLLALGIGTHLVEDVTQYFRLRHKDGRGVERAEFDAACAQLRLAGLRLREPDAAWAAFSERRATYAGNLRAIADFWAVPPAQWVGDRSTRHAPR